MAPEQTILPRTNALITQPVHYFNAELPDSNQPRAGIITGFSTTEGLVNLAVFMDYRLDMMNGSAPMKNVNGVLLVADRSDAPLGVRDVAVLKGHTGIPTRMEVVETKTTGGAQAPKNTKPKTQKPDAAPTPPNTTPPADEAPGASGGGGADSPNEGRAEGDGEQAPAASDLMDPEEVEAEAFGDKAEKLGPIDHLLKSPAWATAIEDPEIIRAQKVGDQVLAIYLASHPQDDRPFAKITYEGVEPDADDSTRGYYLKVRDKAGRCSVAVAAVAGRFGSPTAATLAMSNLLVGLVELAVLASRAAQNDHGSQWANMHPKLQDLRKPA